MFITFEGGEGTGKSTQAKLLAERLRGQGVDVVTTREPGGTPEAEAIRNILVNGNPDSLSPEAEALLNYAARDHHLRHLIRPALSAGKTVICDRFIDSTCAYQSYAGGAAASFIDALEAEIVGKSLPTHTLIFDLDPVLGLERAKGRGGADRFERKGLEFHQRLRAGFLDIAAKNPGRCRVIDAAQPLEAVQQAVWRAIYG
jgi:dTMP kinase